MLKLRPYKACDASYIIKWVSNPMAFYQWSADRLADAYPLTEERLNAYYDSLAFDNTSWQMTAIDEDGIVRGHLTMRYVDKKMNVLRLGFIIIDTDLRGKGWGRELVLLAVKYGFDILNAHEITLGVFENNPAAFRCYQSVGFMPTEKTYYNIGTEKWGCMEMKIIK